jgi:hypothetical protein
MIYKTQHVKPHHEPITPEPENNVSASWEIIGEY